METGIGLCLIAGKDFGARPTVTLNSFYSADLLQLPRGRAPMQPNERLARSAERRSSGVEALIEFAD